MNTGSSTTDGTKAGNGSLAFLALLSLLVGATTGLVGTAFRLALGEGDHLRERVIQWGYGLGISGFMALACLCALTAAIAAWLVRCFSPHASGSGIPHVEAVLNGELPPAPLGLVPVKFVGGLLAIGSGLALGREGPSVQMGASVSYVLGRIFRRCPADCLVLLAGGAGAGLATAFNAPIAGAVFVLEELVRRFDTRIAIVTFGTSAGAIAVGRLFLGDAPDFQVAAQPYPGFATVPIHLGLGVLAGILGIAYNRTILGTLALGERYTKCPVELRAAIIGVVVALFAWFMPGLVGGGDAITQRTLSGYDSLRVIAMVFLLRFALGPLSYAAKTPGGLFAPLLVLGAQSGLLFGHLSAACFPAAALDPVALAIVGMAAFFTAVVRSPLTGIVLVIEMTGSFTLLLPMLSACFAAMLIPTVLKEAPIYDSLREPTLRVQQRLQEVQRKEHV
jgi:CIC family chloride channel protein